MFAFILLILVFGLFMASFVVLIMDLTSSKRNTNRPTDEKLPKLGKYSFGNFSSAGLLLFLLVEDKSITNTKKLAINSPKTSINNTNANIIKKILLNLI